MGLGPTKSAYFGVYSRGAASGSCSRSCSHSSEDVPTLKGELSEVKKKMKVMARFISKQFPGQNWMEDAENNLGASTAPSLSSRAS
ncbi:unnamed protein product [Linum trigynum]|uniref:Uncharacterized protein n=1 Tax=Linum trigynum TaxID=586398 RepID=A0AAV2FCV5_9ROSI